jgi:hypothetical protein
MSAIIVPNADFSANAVEKIHLNTLSPILTLNAGDGRQVRYLNMQGSSQVLACYKNKNLQHECVFIYNVEDSSGRTLEITAAHIVVSGAEFCCFASDADLDAIEAYETTAINNTSDVGPQLKGEITAVENFNVSEVTNVENTVIKVIPETAKYLIITNAIDIVPADDVIVELV